MSFAAEYKNHSSNNPNPNPAKATLFDILNDLRSRSGDFDDMMGNLDPETMDELLRYNFGRITSQLRPWSPR